MYIYIWNYTSKPFTSWHSPSHPFLFKSLNNLGDPSVLPLLKSRDVTHAGRSQLGIGQRTGNGRAGLIDSCDRQFPGPVGYRGTRVIHGQSSKYRNKKWNTLTFPTRAWTCFLWKEQNPSRIWIRTSNSCLDPNSFIVNKTKIWDRIRSEHLNPTRFSTNYLWIDLNSIGLGRTLGF